MKVYSYCLLFLVTIFSTNKLVISQTIDTNQINDIFQLGWNYIGNNNDSSEILLNTVIKNSTEIKYYNGLSKAYNGLGVLYKVTGEFGKSKQYLKQAIQLRKTIGDKKGLASSYDNLGTLFKKFNQNDSSFIYHIKSLKLRIEINLPQEINKSYNSLGIFFDDTKQHDSALYYFKKTYSYFKSIGDTLYIAKALNNISAAYLSLNKCDSAKLNSQEAVKLANYLTDDEILSESLPNLALSYNCAGDFLNANLTISKAITLDKALGNYSGLLDDYLSLSEILINQNNPDSALSIYSLIINLTDTIEYNETRLEAYKMISNLYYLKFDYKNSLENLQKYINLNDSLNNLERIKSIEEYRIVYDSEKQELENIALKDQNAKEKAQKQLFIIFVISLSTLLIIGSIIFFQQKKLSHKKSLLQQSQIESLLSTQELKSINAMVEGQEDERKRIAEDLHDRVGSILSTVKLYFNSLNTKIDKYQGENKLQYDKANTLLDEAVQEVRRISHNLVSGILMKFGLSPALKDLCETVEGTQQIKIKLTTHGIDERLENQIEISSYRIIQELLSNILKHAKATEVNLSITRQDGNLNIMIEDNGIGFDIKRNHEGIGLKNIRSRIEKLHGTINFDSVIDRGTIVNIDIPIEHNEENI